MSEYIKRSPIYRQSEKAAPFCPDCGTELNWLDMVNSHSQCKCGVWVDTISPKQEGGEYFKPDKPRKPYTLRVNGKEHQS